MTRVSDLKQGIQLLGIEPSKSVELVGLWSIPGGLYELRYKGIDGSMFSKQFHVTQLEALTIKRNYGSLQPWSEGDPEEPELNPKVPPHWPPWYRYRGFFEVESPTVDDLEFLVDGFGELPCWGSDRDSIESLANFEEDRYLRFALTIHGYVQAGKMYYGQHNRVSDFNMAAAIRTRVDLLAGSDIVGMRQYAADAEQRLTEYATLLELRIKLFFEQRAAHHRGDSLTIVMPQLRVVACAMRNIIREGRSGFEDVPSLPDY